MNSPVLEAIKPRYRVVAGTHKTARSRCAIYVMPISGRGGELRLNFGSSADGMCEQYARPADLRELAELLTAMADAMDAA